MLFDRRVAHQQHRFPSAGGQVHHPRQALIPFLLDKFWQAYLIRCGGDRNILQIASIYGMWGVQRAELTKDQCGRLHALSMMSGFARHRTGAAVRVITARGALANLLTYLCITSTGFKVWHNFCRNCHAWLCIGQYVCMKGPRAERLRVEARPYK